MRAHLEVLTARQHRVLRRVGPLLRRRRFYLGGGTALALHLGHRRSVDLDWFTTERFADPLGLAQELRDEGLPLVTQQAERGTWHGRLSGVRLSLLEYRYPLLRPLTVIPVLECALAAPEDLAAMKLSAVADRGAKKDFVDLYALVVQKVPLRQMLEWYQRKYSVQDLAHLLYSLVYFDDADRQRMPQLLWDTNWRTVKKALRQWVREVAG